MDSRTFYTQLSIVSVFVALLLVMLHSTTAIAIHQVFSWISWGFFVLFCIVLYYLAALSTQSTDKGLFARVFLYSIFFKMLFSILIIVAYVLITKTKDMYFVFPFLIVYLFFTIFEVSFITKLSKTNV